MNKSYFLIATACILVLGVATLLYLSQGVQRTFKSEVIKEINNTGKAKTEILTENDIRNLPAPVQKYLKYTGVIGKEKVKSIQIVSNIDIDLGSGRGWTKMKAVEYNFFGENPFRAVLMNFKMKGFIPVAGLDSYIRGKGGMLMKPFGLFAAVNARGHKEDDTSAAVMMLLNMCTTAPSTLTDDRIEWASISPLSVKASFNDGKCTVSGVLEFDEKGELINFSTEDKYYLQSDGNYKKVTWSAPILSYKEINGLKLSSYGEAIWHFDEGKYIYGKSTLQSIEYNIKEY